MLTNMTLPHDTDTVAPLLGALRELAATAERAADQLETEIGQALTLVRETVQRGGTLLFCGNGGSAADAQHLATE